MQQRLNRVGFFIGPVSPLLVVKLCNFIWRYWGMMEFKGLAYLTTGCFDFLYLRFDSIPILPTV